jgi:hypothetical protein
MGCVMNKLQYFLTSGSSSVFSKLDSMKSLLKSAKQANSEVETTLNMVFARMDNVLLQST